MKKTKQIVLGLGEIGSAIRKILDCDGYDSKNGELNGSEQYDVIHVCFPYFPSFVETVMDYRKKLDARLVIVHSTVPIGTSLVLESVASPCRGVHPHLEEGIRTFVKFFGGKQAEEAAEYFSELGIPTLVDPDSRSVEAMKLWDTTIYGFNIALEKEIFDYCDRNGLNFDRVYTQANLTYNEGYEKLGMPQFKKYVLKHHKGKIGGHCVIPNCQLLDSWVAKYVESKNANDF